MESKRGQEKEVQKPPPRASCSNRASLVSVLQASLPCQLPVWPPSASSGAPVSRLCPATSLTTAVTVIPADLLSVSHALFAHFISIYSFYYFRVPDIRQTVLCLSKRIVHIYVLSHLHLLFSSPVVMVAPAILSYHGNGHSFPFIFHSFITSRR